MLLFKKYLQKYYFFIEKNGIIFLEEYGGGTYENII